MPSLRSALLKSAAPSQAAPVEAPRGPPVGDPLVLFKELPEHGIRYSYVWLRELIKRGAFPAAVKIGSGPNGKVAWRLSEIEAWKASRPFAAAVPPASRKPLKVG